MGRLRSRTARIEQGSLLLTFRSQPAAALVTLALVALALAAAALAAALAAGSTAVV